MEEKKVKQTNLNLKKKKKKTSFFRKSKVGDWKNLLTLEMATWLDQMIEQKLTGAGLTLHTSTNSMATK